MHRGDPQVGLTVTLPVNLLPSADRQIEPDNWTGSVTPVARSAMQAPRAINAKGRAIGSARRFGCL
jgi:hypothetical protein